MLSPFGSIYFVDFEYHAVNGIEGNPPHPVCMVVRDFCAGTVHRYFRQELECLREAPFDTGPSALFIAYYAAAELDSFLQLGWPLLVNVLDLYIEFRKLTNGLPLKHGSGLLGAMVHFGLCSIAVEEKAAMRELILSRGPWTPAQETAILDYCQSAVDALQALFLKMQPMIDWPRALLRGRYMKAVSCIQRSGIPIDVSELARIQQYWDAIRGQLISRIDTSYGVYEGDTFKASRFETFLQSAGIPWPRLASGALDLSDDAFRQAARGYPRIAPPARAALDAVKASAQRANRGRGRA